MSDPGSESSRNLSALVDVVRRLGETFDLDSLLRTVEQAGLSVLNCERATVFLYDPARDELYSKVATGTGEIRFSAKLGIAGEAAKSKSIILVPDAYADARFNRDIDRKTGFRTRNLLTLPLVAPDGEVVGVLQVLNKRSGDFDENDRLLAEALESLTGVAVKRQMLLDESEARKRLESDLNIARGIQQRLLPKEMPHVPGFDIDGWNLPAEQTGGDSYDAFSLPDGRIALMIADATGHGIGPALIISQCRSMLRAMADMSSSPARLLRRLNDLLCDDLPTDRFVTLCLTAVDGNTHQLEFVSGGHGPQIHFQAATGEAQSFIANGFPLGIMAGAQFEPAEPIVLQPGDVFVMLTDGFLEWSRTDGTQYGEERLIQLLRRCSTLPCGELIQCIYRDVLDFAQGSPQLDDLTVVVVKRNT